VVTGEVQLSLFSRVSATPSGSAMSGDFLISSTTTAEVLKRIAYFYATRVAPDFGSSSSKSGIRPFFGNPAKFGSVQISSRIWQYVQLVTDGTKINAADLSRGVFAILVRVTRTIKIQNPLPFHKFRQELANGGVTKET